MPFAPKIKLHVTFRKGMPPIAWSEREPRLCSICFGSLPEVPLMLFHREVGAAFCDPCVEKWITAEHVK